MLEDYATETLIKDLLIRGNVPDDRDIEMAIREVEEFIEFLSQNAQSVKLYWKQETLGSIYALSVMRFS
jgi:hypothetical protein